MVDMDLWTQHVAFARRHRPATFERLVDEYRGFAVRAAKRQFRHGEPLDDLVQVALEGLIQALHRFEPERRTPFLAFAQPTVVGTLRRHFRDVGWSVRVPRRVHDLAAPMRDATDWLCQDLGREPTSRELSDFLGVSEDEVLAAQVATDARRTASVDATDSEFAAGRGHPALVANDRGLATADDHVALERSLERLSDDDRSLLHVYYVEERTQSEIAGELGCSQMQVSRLLSRAVRRLRVQLVES